MHKLAKSFLLSRASLCIRFHCSSSPFFSTVHHRASHTFAFFFFCCTTKPSPFCYTSLHTTNYHLRATNRHHLHATNHRCCRTMSLRCRRTTDHRCHHTTNHCSPHHEPPFAAPWPVVVDKNPCLAWKLSHLDVVDVTAPPLKLL